MSGGPWPGGSTCSRIAVRSAIALFVLGNLSATQARSQDFDLGHRVPGVHLAVGLDPYDITGSTAAQILRQLQTAGPRSVVHYSSLFTWTFDAESFLWPRASPPSSAASPSSRWSST